MLQICMGHMNDNEPMKFKWRSVIMFSYHETKFVATRNKCPSVPRNDQYQVVYLLMMIHNFPGSEANLTHSLL